METNKNEAEQAPADFNCTICDFKSKWKNGLSVHITRKHGRIEQLDGNCTDTEDSDVDEQYFRTRHYWEFGRLGSAYQTYIDACEIIEKSDLEDVEKEKEKVKLLDARKSAFGSNYKFYPPWCLLP